jgi:nitrogen-specific signal transduction histidine kinase/CheY-like chemotaxis protein
VVNARDITERRRLEERLIQAQKMEAVGRLAGGVAHDFNNLLTAILGNSEMLLQQEGAGAGASECVLEIRKAAHRAAALTRQLLAYSRRQVLQPKVVDLNELVEGMRKMLARLIGEDVRVVVRPAPGLRSVRVDPFQIEQVIMNLAVNARDAMPDGGSLVIETQNVVLEHEYCQGFPDLAPGAYVMLAVSDSGCGMGAKVMARLFEPFFTTKETGKGTGLGLATVYGIVRQSGGHISAYSEVGRGSTFKVFLPICEEQRKIQDGIPEPGQDPTGVESVLLVEDEEALRGIAKRILEHSGYRVSVAESAETAMRNLETFGDIDLLVTDVILPGMNGRSLSDTLTRWRPGLKTLYISGHTEDAILHHGVLAEGIAFLQKPFTGQALTRKVREVLDADGVPRSKESTGLVGTPAP